MQGIWELMPHLLLKLQNTQHKIFRLSNYGHLLSLTQLGTRLEIWDLVKIQFTDDDILAQPLNCTGCPNYACIF